jgi:pyridoxine 5-phosphate synthase
MPPVLSVNVNKVALLRNSRGRNEPDLLAAIDTVIAAGAAGITVHPRRDERHVRLADVPVFARHLRDHHPGVELNVECEDHPALVALVLDVKPDQCTLVPVTPGEVTSDHGWDLPRESDRLRPTLRRLRDAGVRTSGFADADAPMAAFADVGFDRAELYTGPFAWAWGTAEQEARTAELVAAAASAGRAGLGLNAGHDLDRHNVAGVRDLPGLREVSIGHAIVCRALEVGLATAVRELLDAINSRGAAPGP